MDAETTLLFDLTLMLIVAGVCSIVLRRLKLPTIIGYVLAGFLLGPNIFPAIVIQESTVSIFASMGIVLLMFFIGLELNLKGLRKVASYALIIVAIEMSLMVMIGYTIGSMLGLTSPQALFLGVTISCASTAVALSIMKDNPAMKGRLAHAVTGILIMEDIGLIIILAITDPVIGNSSSTSIVETLLVIICFIGLSVVLGLAFVPRMLNWIHDRYSGEILSLVAIGVGFGLAFISSAIGLSVAIGAFLAGIVVSKASCVGEVIHRVEPMKELFMAIFFISIGMALDPALMIAGLPLAITIAVIFILGKLASVGIGCYVANFKLRSSFYIASSMVAMGEFTFVVAKVALDGGVIDTELYSSVIGAAVITMLVVPSISRMSPRIFDAVVARLPPKVFQSLDRIENMRQEVRGRMAGSSEVRNTVRKQLFLVFIDFIIIVAVLLTVNLLSTIEEFTDSVSASINILPSLILFIIAVAFIVPAVIHMSKRLQIVSRTIANSVVEGRLIGSEVHLKTYRLFKNIGTAFTAGMLFLLVFPLLPRVEGISISPLGIIFAIAVVAWLAWDSIDSAYDRISNALSQTLDDSQQDDNELTDDMDDKDQVKS